MNDVRALAAQVVAAVALEGGSLGRELARRENVLDGRDRGLLRELCYGTLRWHPLLQAVIERLLAKPFKRKDADIEQLLLVGAYQLMHTRIPEHAAISATVESCRLLGKSWATGLANGVLRNVQRRGTAVIDQLPMPARDAHPEWLWQRIHGAWPEQAEGIFHANNDYPPFYLRVNERRTSRDDYLAELGAAGIDAMPCEIATTGIRLERAVDVTQLPGFGEGMVSVQDEAAQLAAPLLDLQPGQRVLDACCAPGGKTGHILEAALDLDLCALDSDPERLRRVEENLRRLQLNARLVTGDACDPAAWWDGRPFDRILLDAPCSGTGVIRRHPDIKLLRTERDIATLAVRQGKLLAALWPLLAPGGLLVYATCSILPTENRDVVGDFITAHTDAVALPMPGWGVPQPVGRQLLPQRAGCDGFYYARLGKPAATPPR